MFVDILILLAGLCLVVLGADWLVDGSSAIARKAGLSEFVIGLTIVGIGTSCPELVVSLTGALQGNADIAIGNVVGSNIFNVFLILGVTALIHPVALSRDNRRKDIPVNIAVSLLLILLGLQATIFGIGEEDVLSRIDGAFFLLLYAGYLWHSIKNGKAEASEDEQAAKEKEIKVWAALLMIVAGLAGLVFGGDLFVDKATAIARRLHVSDKFIAVTILACGTSMPELVTSIVAAAKKKGMLALGNILGSNVCNILLILGASAVAYKRLPGGSAGLSFGGMTPIDLSALVLSAVILLIAAWTGRNNKIGKADGAMFILCFAAYMAYLLSAL